jgi:head-tail adaptor
MGINHLLKNTCTIYAETTAPDAVGQPVKTLTEVVSTKCRIEKLNESREVRLGKDNSKSTHRIYLSDSDFSNLSYDSIFLVDGQYYDVVFYENLDPILTNTRLKHVEVDVRWREEGLYG